MIFDSHSHYDDKQFDEDRDELLKSLKDNNVARVVDVCAEYSSIDKVLDLVSKYDFMYAAVGVHPDAVGALDDDSYEVIKKAALSSEKVVAIGEIGLDYYWDENPRDVQKKWFDRQLDIALEVNKPVIIHSREAASDTMDILRSRKLPESVMHCYSYSKETARELLNMGFYLGIGGVVTFKNSKKLKEVVEYMPLDRILLETDCPYLAPTPFRGKRNESSYIKYVIEEIASLKGVDPLLVEETCWNNTNRFYGIAD